MGSQSVPEVENNRISKPPHNLAASIGRNTVFGALANAAQALTRLVTVPMIIAHLGLDGYGIWSIIMSVSAYMRFGSVGIKSAFQKYVAEATGSGDYEKAGRLLSTGSTAMLVLSVAGLIPVVIFSRQVAEAASVPAQFLPETAQSISILALIMLLSNVGAVYEAIVTGGHRIDLARTFTTCFTVAEAVAIVIVLYAGFGLLAMAWVMAVSEIGFIFCCYLASKRVVPEIRLRREDVTAGVLGELVRFAGSYQLVNILEVLYTAILPLVILRTFGAEAAGTYAVAMRLVVASMMLPNAFLIPILSGATMIYASGSTERMRELLIKSFKVTLGLTLLPLGFIAIFGTDIVRAWTGQEEASMGEVLKMCCLAGLFNAFSMLQLVLYRVSGRAIMDNIRQAVRIVILASISLWAGKLGFIGALSGLAIAEFAGMAFMMGAMVKTFPSFRLRSLAPDALKLIAATTVVLSFAVLAIQMPLPELTNMRTFATLKLCVAAVACILAGLPALLLTRFLTETEKSAIFSIFFSRFGGVTRNVVHGESESS